MAPGRTEDAPPGSRVGVVATGDLAQRHGLEAEPVAVVATGAQRLPSLGVVAAVADRDRRVGEKARRPFVLDPDRCPREHDLRSMDLSGGLEGGIVDGDGKGADSEVASSRITESPMSSLATRKSSPVRRHDYRETRPFGRRSSRAREEPAKRQPQKTPESPGIAAAHRLESLPPIEMTAAEIDREIEEVRGHWDR